MSLNFNIKIQKKDLWLLSAIVVFLVGVAYVIAYNSAMSGGTPSVMGHSSDEVMVMNKTGSLISLQTFIDQSGLGAATYVSGWQSISPQGSVTFNHNLGTDQITVFIQVRELLTSPIHQQHHADYSGWGLGVEAYEITSTQIKVSAGNYIRVFSSTGQTINYDPAYIRVLAIKI